MPLSRDELKRLFQNGTRPDEEDFQNLFESGIALQDDGVAIDIDQNIGLGILSPDTRLHVGGGILVDNVAGTDSNNIAQGTLRWTGARLEIFFGNRWFGVWPIEPVDPLSAEANPVRTPVSNPARSRTLLESNFTNDVSLNASNFDNVVDSFVNMEDEDIHINPANRIGLGLSNPLSKLHINGGLLIGNVPEASDTRSETAKIGTLRWTGSSLEIYHSRMWNVIWPISPVIETFDETYNLNLTIPGNYVTVSSRPSHSFFQFPPDAFRIRTITVIASGIINGRNKPQGIPREVLLMTLKQGDSTTILTGFFPSPSDIPSPPRRYTITFPIAISGSNLYNTEIDPSGQFLFEFRKEISGQPIGIVGDELRIEEAIINYERIR